MGQNIVVIDDDPDAREILGLVLSTLEIDIRQASNGLEGIHLILSDPPLMAIIDLSMPHLDGRGVLQKLRTDPATCTLPIVVFTAEDATPELAEELNIPLSRLVRKGKLSMTGLRSIAIEILGPKLTVNLSLL